MKEAQAMIGVFLGFALGVMVAYAVHEVIHSQRQHGGVYMKIYRWLKK